MPKVLRYDVVFEKAPEGGYTVIVPALPGCISEGDSLKEARKNIEDAIIGYLESLQKDGLNISKPNKSIFESIEIATNNFAPCAV